MVGADVDVGDWLGPKDLEGNTLNDGIAEGTKVDVGSDVNVGPASRRWQLRRNLRRCGIAFFQIQRQHSFVNPRSKYIPT